MIKKTLVDTVNKLLAKDRVTIPDYLLETTISIRFADRVYQVETDWIAGQLIGSVFEIGYDEWGGKLDILRYRMYFGKNRKTGFIGVAEIADGRKPTLTDIRVRMVENQWENERMQSDELANRNRMMAKRMYMMEDLWPSGYITRY